MIEMKNVSYSIKEGGKKRTLLKILRKVLKKVKYQ